MEAYIRTCLWSEKGLFAFLDADSEQWMGIWKRNGLLANTQTMSSPSGENGGMKKEWNHPRQFSIRIFKHNNYYYIVDHGSHSPKSILFHLYFTQCNKLNTNQLDMNTIPVGANWRKIQCNPFFLFTNLEEYSQADSFPRKRNDDPSKKANRTLKKGRGSFF